MRSHAATCNLETAPVFVAIDFETADEGKDSACAVALVRVEGETVVRTVTRLIRPPRALFLFTDIHGLTWEMVRHEPTFADVWPELAPELQGATFLAAHNSGFDQAVLRTCCRLAGLEMPALPFECTVELARRVWNLRPTKLPDVCRFLGLQLNHHDPTSDAEACARIVIAARRSLREQAIARQPGPAPEVRP